MRVVGRKGGDLWREHGGESVRIGRVLDVQDFGDTLDVGRFRRDGRRSGAKDGYRQFGPRDGRRACGAFGRARIELAAAVFADDENGAHDTRPFLRSASTSSSTVLTMTPFWR